MMYSIDWKRMCLKLSTITPFRPSAYMDNTRIREEVGYRPEYTIERAITEYIDWLRRHPE